MIVTIIVRKFPDKHKIVVDNFYPILGNPFTVAAMMIHKYCAAIDKDWKIDSFGINDGELLTSYFDEYEVEDDITIGDVMAAATDNDYADVGSIKIPKFKIE